MDGDKKSALNLADIQALNADIKVLNEENQKNITDVKAIDISMNSMIETYNQTYGEHLTVENVEEIYAKLNKEISDQYYEKKKIVEDIKNGNYKTEQVVLEDKGINKDTPNTIATEVTPNELEVTGNNVEGVSEDLDSYDFDDENTEAKNDTEVDISQNNKQTTDVLSLIGDNTEEVGNVTDVIKTRAIPDSTVVGVGDKPKLVAEHVEVSNESKATTDVQRDFWKKMKTNRLKTMQNDKQ